MIAHNTFLVLLVGYIVAAPVAIAFSCNPPVLLFRLETLGRTTGQRRCFNQNKALIPLSALHTAFDFALLAVPLVVLFKMQMDISRKIRLCVLFSVGSLSCIGAVMRCLMQSSKQPDITCKFASATRPMQEHSRLWSMFPDHTYASLDQYPEFQRWVIVDIFFAITAASLPVLNALLPRHWHTYSNSDATPADTWTWERKKGEDTELGSTSTLKDSANQRITIHCENILENKRTVSLSESQVF